MYLACTYRRNTRIDKGITKSTEIMRHHEAQGRLWLIHKGNTEGKQTSGQHTCNGSSSYRSVKWWSKNEDM